MMIKQKCWYDPESLALQCVFHTSRGALRLPPTCTALPSSRNLASLARLPIAILIGSAIYFAAPSIDRKSVV